MIDIAISPCPNDTFLFHGWLTGKIDSEIMPKVTFADIQMLNQFARSSSHTLIKVSTYCYGKITNDYELLPVGAAIGQFGPKLIAKTPQDASTIGTKTIAVPGVDTTAYLLLKILFPTPLKVIFCRYDEILQLLDAGVCDLGLIIHETRFTFKDLGFIEIADLGELFYAKYNLPVPLGVLCIKRTVPEELKNEITTTLQRSLLHAQNDPDNALDFILEHSIEKEIAVVKEHIATYVTKESYQ